MSEAEVALGQSTMLLHNLIKFLLFYRLELSAADNSKLFLYKSTAFDKIFFLKFENPVERSRVKTSGKAGGLI